MAAQAKNPTGPVPFTREGVERILHLDQVNQVKAAESYLSRAAKVWQDESKAIDVRDGKRTLTASLATFTAETVGLIPAKGERVKSDSPDYMLTGDQYAGKYGVKGGTVTAWRALGRALVVIGVNPDEKETPDQPFNLWRLLTSKNAVSAAVVTDAIYASDATIDSVREAVLTVRKSDGSTIPKGGTGTPRVGQGAGQPAPVTPEQAVEALTPLDAALSAVKILVAAFKVQGEGALSYSEASDLLTSLSEMVDRETTLVVKREGAPKPKAAPKRPARKSTAARKAAAA